MGFRIRPYKRAWRGLREMQLHHNRVARPVTLSGWCGGGLGRGSGSAVDRYGILKSRASCKALHALR